MGVSKFSKRAYEKEKNNKPFILTVIVIVMFMYNTINTYYNEAIYKITETGIVGEIIEVEGYMSRVVGQTTSSLQMNLFLIIGTAALLIIFSSTIYIKEKSKNIACMFYSGGSYSDALIFLVYNNMKSFLYAITIGVVCGIITSPIYNIALYKLIGTEGPILTFYPDGIGILAMYLVIIIIASIMVNWGFVYRKDTIGLMNLDAAKNVGDKRSKKLHWSIIVLLYISPIFILFGFSGSEGVQDVVGVSSYLSLGMIYWLVTYSIGDMIEAFKKRKFMYKNNRIIYIGNAMKVVKEAFSYMVIFLFMIIYTVNGVSGLIVEPGVKESLAISLIGIGVCMSASLGYKLSVEFKEINQRAFQLRVIGFSDKQIIKCVRSEVMVILVFTVVTPLITLVTNLLGYAFQGDVSLLYSLGVIVGICGPIVGIAMIMSGHYSNKIKINLEKKEKADTKKIAA